MLPAPLQHFGPLTTVHGSCQRGQILASAKLHWSAIRLRSATLRYSIDVTLDGCCEHREMIADEDLHRHAMETYLRVVAKKVGHAFASWTGFTSPIT
jgi:hypothetical protein